MNSFLNIDDGIDSMAFCIMRCIRPMYVAPHPERALLVKALQHRLLGATLLTILRSRLNSERLPYLSQGG